MDAERYQRLKQLLFEANRVAVSDRDAFLDRECGKDLELRQEVASLLRGAQVNTVELQSPVNSAALGATDLPEPPWHCGPYRIVGEIGRGGMGIVFEARDLCRRHRTFSAETGAKRSEAVAIGSLGMIEMLLGHAERARALLMDARQRGAATHAPQLSAGYDLQLGRVAILQQDLEQAAKHLASAAEEFRRIGNRDLMARALIDLAAVQAADRKPRLEEALTIGEDLDLPPVIFGALALLGEEDRAREVDREVGGRIPIFERLVGYARLGWNDRAREMLQRIVDGAPEEEREGLVERVPFYRGL